MYQLSNKKFKIQPTLINLHPNEYSQEFRDYPFSVKLDRFIGSCNTVNNLPNKVCTPNKTEVIILSVLNTIKGKHESKTITKHIACECKCKIDGTKCRSNQSWNNYRCQCECKKHHICEKNMFGILAHAFVENEKVLWMFQ